MSTYIVAKDFSFEASHQLDPNLLGVTHKCCRLHGHSYRIRVHCSASKLDHRGFVVDYAEISEAVNPLVDSLDHQFLNDLLPFHTTAENLSAWFYEKLKPLLPTLVRVDVFETAKTCCTYIP